MARVDPDVGQDLEWKAAEYRYSYNIGTIECVAFPRFQKSSPYESEREARITFPKETFLWYRKYRLTLLIKKKAP